MYLLILCLSLCLARVCLPCLVSGVWCLVYGVKRRTCKDSERPLVERVESESEEFAGILWRERASRPVTRGRGAGAG